MNLTLLVRCKPLCAKAPDVIVIGESREGETAEITLQAAETGHVVIGTLHSSTLRKPFSVS